jgi:hypothetical protein
MDRLNGNRHQRRNRNKKVKGWGRKMKNRAEWRRVVQEAKPHPELQCGGERRKEG